MPQKKKPTLSQMLTPRGRTTTDMANRTNVVPRNAGSSLDAPLNQVPRDVSPDMHRYFSDSLKIQDPTKNKKKKNGWKNGTLA